MVYTSSGDCGDNENCTDLSSLAEHIEYYDGITPLAGRIHVHQVMCAYLPAVRHRKDYGQVSTEVVNYCIAAIQTYLSHYLILSNAWRMLTCSINMLRALCAL